MKITLSMLQACKPYRDCKVTNTKIVDQLIEVNGFDGNPYIHFPYMNPEEECYGKRVAGDNDMDQ